jgi:hypothetical protein
VLFTAGFLGCLQHRLCDDWTVRFDDLFFFQLARYDLFNLVLEA